jgi:hypothetical protein
MGTRSRIGVMHGDVCKSVYCHWDGYLEHNGLILQGYYDSSRANELVAHGDISSLGRLIGEKHPFSPHASAEDKIAHEAADAAGWTTFYARDRGETGVEFATDLTFESFLNRVEDTGAEYYYIMRDGVWYTGCPGKGSKLVALVEALAAIKEPVNA